MHRGEDNLWSLLSDMWPLLFMLALTALAGFLFLRTTREEVQRAKGGRYYRAYQLYLLVTLAFLIYRGYRLIVH
jgi:hypothetical protein